MRHARWHVCVLSSLFLVLASPGFARQSSEASAQPKEVAPSSSAQEKPPTADQQSQQQSTQRTGPADSQQTRTQRAAEGGTPDSSTSYATPAVGLVVAVTLLMATLFYFLFQWSARVERAGYFASLFIDAIENIEYARLSGPVAEQWKRRDYHRELLSQSSDRARKWAAESTDNKAPYPTDRLLSLAQQLGRSSTLAESQWQFEFLSSGAPLDDPWVSTSPPGLVRPSRESRIGPQRGGSSKPSEPEPPRPPSDDEMEFEDLLLEYQLKVKAWIDSARVEVARWYQDDLDRVRVKAQKQARYASEVDFSALRGRGPEFVLSFTTVVIIIFAAIVLGILKILDTQQIGTLLAAIAGYVLGRSATRSSGTTAEPVAASASGQKAEVS